MKFSNDIEELVYLEYQDIDHRAYQEKIRYFERNKTAIGTLPYEFRLEMSLEYTVALFEVGEYYSYLKLVDDLLARVVEENIFSVDGDDIYQELLYRKAASLHNVLDYHGSDHVLTELCRIDFDNVIYRKTYLKNYIDRKRSAAQKARAMTIALFMAAGLVIGLELLVVRPFYAELTSNVELTRNILFGSAVLLMICHELHIRFQAYKSLLKLKKSK